MVRGNYEYELVELRRGSLYWNAKVCQENITNIAPTLFPSTMSSEEVLKIIRKDGKTKINKYIRIVG